MAIALSGLPNKALSFLSFLPRRERSLLAGKNTIGLIKIVIKLQNSLIRVLHLLITSGYKTFRKTCDIFSRYHFQLFFFLNYRTAVSSQLRNFDISSNLNFTAAFLASYHRFRIYRLIMLIPVGGTWVFFWWLCAARDSKLAPRSRKNFP